MYRSRYHIIIDILKSRAVIITASLTLILFTVVMSTCITASGDTTKKQKYYKSIIIESGDTLWDIAEQYYDSDVVSITEYIEELKEINNLSGERIRSGNYIVVSYYAE